MKGEIFHQTCQRQQKCCSLACKNDERQTKNDVVFLKKATFFCAFIFEPQLLCLHGACDVFFIFFFSRSIFAPILKIILASIFCRQKQRRFSYSSNVAFLLCIDFFHNYDVFLYLRKCEKMKKFS